MSDAPSRKRMSTIFRLSFIRICSVRMRVKRKMKTSKMIWVLHDIAVSICYTRCEGSVANNVVKGWSVKNNLEPHTYGPMGCQLRATHIRKRLTDEMLNTNQSDNRYSLMKAQHPSEWNEWRTTPTLYITTSVNEHAITHNAPTPLTGSEAIQSARRKIKTRRLLW